jgi:glycosyltransferase involved in cell wall biosynthesis
MPTALRVAYVSPAWPPGRVQNGVATYVGHLRDALAALGVPSAVITREAGNGAEATVEPMDERGGRAFARRVMAAWLRRCAPQRVLPVMAALGIRDAARRLAARFPFGVLEMEESFGTAAGVIGRIAAPVVVRLHGPWFLTGAASGVPDDATFRARVARERRAIVRAAAVTAPSHALLRAVREHYGEPLPHGEVVPNPGPPLPAAPMWQPHRDRPRLVHIGRFERLKGSDVAIAAFAQLARELPDLRLQLIGPDRGMPDASGTLQPFPRYLAGLGIGAAIASRIEFTGPVPPATVDELRRAAAVTLVPSRYENFPMAVLEAMADGCPIVASRTGGIPEMLADGETALLVPPGDADALAAALRPLLANGGEAARLGAAARARYRAAFTPAAVAARMLDVYRRVAPAPGARG